MDNDYSNELKDLEGVYCQMLDKYNDRVHEKLEKLVKVMEDFVLHHKAKSALRTKLAVLQSKLKTEECFDEDEEDEEKCNKCCCCC